jgi:hypothetical protein
MYDSSENATGLQYMLSNNSSLSDPDQLRDPAVPTKSRCPGIFPRSPSGLSVIFTTHQRRVLRHYATNRKVAGLRPDEVDFF